MRCMRAPHFDFLVSALSFPISDASESAQNKGKNNHNIIEQEGSLYDTLKSQET